MAGISSTLSRSDLKFMAEDIGLELVAFLKPEELLSAMTPAKRRKLMKLFDAKQLLETIPVEERFSGISAEELLQGIHPEQRKALLELLLKTASVNQPDPGETNSKNGHN